MTTNEKIQEKLQMAQNILKNRPEISRVHLARLVHTDQKRISAWEHAGFLKFRPQPGGWKHYGFSFSKKAM
jgi:hypothetical protein